MEGQINQNALDEQLAKFPMRFTTSVIVGPKPQAGASVTVNTGSAVLVDLGKGPIAITCQHVVAEAMKPLPNGEKKRFQVGGHVFDLNSRLIDSRDRGHGGRCVNCCRLSGQELHPDLLSSG